MLSGGGGGKLAKAGYPRHRENGQKEFAFRENTGNLEILPKHREFGLLENFVHFVYVIVTNHVNWHRENLRSDMEKNRENIGNLKMQFEWVPCKGT